jgi:lipid-binding SYLF domain-containing protein
MNVMTTLKKITAIGLLLFVVTGMAQAQSDKEAGQAEVRKSTNAVLNKLYKVQPAARKVISAAPGYAVFSNFGLKILFAGGGTGNGIAVNRENGQETFMKMMEVQAGLGMGIKKFGLIFVFQDRLALERFISSGWEASAQTSAEAISSGKGVALKGAIMVSPGVWVYQVAEDGLALDATIKGTKYFRNDDLN